VTDDPRCHSHRLPRSLLALVVLCVLGLLAGIVLSYVQARRTEARLQVLEEYVQGRGEFRDREADRLEVRLRESFRQGICDLLDQLPEGGLLERPREKYGCGPGIPLDELPPSEAARLQEERARTPSAADPAPTPAPERPDPSDEADRSRPRPEPTEPSRPPPGDPGTPPDAAEPSPAGPTELVCEALDLCLDDG
jgi:hypothetical protein